ncbi:NACHT domain-containing protein [Rhizobium jaguaris]|uniref:NACHT domain-containing protein n=2 Tax=Rhizobium jaguaris TaxID=1312183 RepID=A0A387FHH7_9HYPH|nr:NACHT domain-containing protein [Rhizobium jaguaris]
MPQVREIMPTSGPRLPALPTLSEILPDGTEGGKEFGRIIDLLLFNEWRGEGNKFQPLDDSAGDFRGLDSYRYGRRGNKITGYQYKFYRSPLSSQHRSLIAAAIEQAAENSESKISTYVLVTPDDLTNSGKRKEGGDIAWFEALREKYRSRFEIEHIGHTKIIAMFLRARHLCLFYYPSLVPLGDARRKTIQEVRVQYDENMRRRFGRIEFVGMSVYKEEASRRVPLENIYIPLSLVTEASPEENDDTPRIEPVSLIAPGKKSIVLGDPGSGKSTLVSFLALVGITPALQKRCAGAADDRLPIVVTLRRYADEIKTRKNLSLIDYIVESVQADFNIGAADKNFFEAYIESGRAIIFFDGLDELPGPQFKGLMRRRIDSFCTSYPINTAIVTSRIVGYEADVRFDAPYRHFRVAKLRLTEIEEFVSDWYGERIKEEVERSRNIADLVKVINNPDNDAIRDLSKNPLLLTIVTLVHRIDAVLPDQRVVLYQKCTETLLNTWNKAKKQDDEPIKGRIEQRNRLRVEAIAYWMHRNSLQAKGRAVAPHSEIVKFLTEHIESKEKKRDKDEPSEDQAEEFFTFVRSSAGLMIEAGDGLYSFIHLTFQEYLSATYLTTYGEVGGALSIWNELNGDLENPRWREVVRLLVASLKSAAAQAFFVEKLCEANLQNPSRDCTLLLVGLLRDGIEPAEEKAEQICLQVFDILMKTESPDDIRTINTAVRSWTLKEHSNLETAKSVFKRIFHDASPIDKLTLALINQSAELGPLDTELRAALDYGSHRFVEPLLFGPEGTKPASPIWGEMYLKQTLDAFQDPDSNAASAIGLGISILLDPTEVAERLLSRSLSLLSSIGRGPHRDYTMNLVALAGETNLHPSLREALAYCINPTNGYEERVERGQLIEEFFHRWLSHVPQLKRRGDENTLSEAVRQRLRFFYRKPGSRAALPGTPQTGKPRRTREMALIRRSLKTVNLDAGIYTRMILASDVMRENIVPSFVKEMNLTPPGHWEETLRATLSALVPQAIGRYFDYEEWRSLTARLSTNLATEDDFNWACWLILVDVWVRANRAASTDAPTGLEDLISVSRECRHDPLQFALAFRDMYMGNEAALGRAVELCEAQDSYAYKMLVSAGWPDWFTDETSLFERGSVKSRKKTGRRNP